MPLAIQLGHAGRKASSRAPGEGGAQIPAADPQGWRTVAPSPVPHGADEEAPEALDEAGLARIRDAFVAAALRSVRIGIQAVELHCAHGYLLHEFLSPLANRREDAYGGPTENRIRFPLEVFAAVREALPAEVPVWVRVSATDWVEGGWTPDETVAVARAARARSTCRAGGSRLARASRWDPATRCPSPPASSARPASPRSPSA